MSLWQKAGVALAIYFALASIEVVDQWSTEGIFRIIAVFCLIVAIPSKEKKP